MSKPAAIERLSPRQAKVLRYVASTRSTPVAPEQCIVLIEWSDLPKTDLQARKALDTLRKFGLVKRVNKNQYEATDAGRQAIAYADKQGLWRKPPAPEVTNRFLNRKGQD